MSLESATKKVSATFVYRAFVLVLQLFGASMLAVICFAYKAHIRDEVAAQVAPISTNITQQISIESEKLSKQIKEANEHWAEELRKQNSKFDEYLKTARYNADLESADKISKLEKQIVDNRIAALENLSSEQKAFAKTVLDRLQSIDVKQAEIMTELKNMQRKQP